MMHSRTKTAIRGFLILLALAVLAHLVIQTYRKGNDINVYLFAARQLLDGESIYTNNPFNLYLYSPLFAMLMTPLAILHEGIARMVWMLINVALAVRIWWLLRTFVRDLDRKRLTLWTVLVIILSAGFLNHNLMLGQLTILILWLTIEGIVLITRGKAWQGGLLLALGINFKILPLLALAYLGMRGYFKGLTWVLVFIILTLLAPAIFIGLDHNVELHRDWQTAIHPGGERFAFEDNDGCHSLNAILPAYFYDFSTAQRSIPPYDRVVHFPRRIASLDYSTLAAILLAARLALTALLLAVLWRSSWVEGRLAGLWQRFTTRLSQEFNRASVAVPPDKHTLLWHIAFLCLVTLLVFPHQMKYSMFYFVPVGAYVFHYYLVRLQHGDALTVTSKIVGCIALLLMFVLAFMGRDIIGSHLVSILDYYHFMGLSNLVFVGILWYCRPHRS